MCSAATSPRVATSPPVSTSTSFGWSANAPIRPSRIAAASRSRSALISAVTSGSASAGSSGAIVRAWRSAAAASSAESSQSSRTLARAREQLRALGGLALERGAAAQHVGELGPPRVRRVQRVERGPRLGVVGPGRDELVVRVDRALGQLELLLVDLRDRAQRVARLGRALGDLADPRERLDHLATSGRPRRTGSASWTSAPRCRPARAWRRRSNASIASCGRCELLGVDRGELAQQLRRARPRARRCRAADRCAPRATRRARPSGPRRDTAPRAVSRAIGSFGSMPRMRRSWASASRGRFCSARIVATSISRSAASARSRPPRPCPRRDRRAGPTPCAPAAMRCSRARTSASPPGARRACANARASASNARTMSLRRSPRPRTARYSQRSRDAASGAGRLS